MKKNIKTNKSLIKRVVCEIVMSAIGLGPFVFAQSIAAAALFSNLNLAKAIICIAYGTHDYDCSVDTKR